MEIIDQAKYLQSPFMNIQFNSPEQKKVQSSSRTIKQNFKNLIFFAAVTQSTLQGCRSRGDRPPQILADQLTTSTRGQIMPTTLLRVPPPGFLLPTALRLHEKPVLFIITLKL